MTDILALAATHGCQPPVYAREDRPSLFQCWEDRVLLVASMKGRGQDATAMLREADVYAGHRVAERPERPERAVAMRLPELRLVVGS